MIMLDTNLNWWSGVESVMGNYIIFHEYLQKDLPIHNGIIVYNAPLNKSLWKNEFVAFISASSTYLKAKTLVGITDKIIAFDIESGFELETIIEKDNYPQNQNVIIAKDQFYFNEITTFIQKYTHLQPDHLCEYLEIENSIIVSYYTVDNEVLENYLLVTNVEGEEILHLCIATGLKGIATGTFNVSNSFLSFVKDRKELFIASLN